MIFQRKSHGILHKPSVPCTIYGYGTRLVCIYKFTIFRACIIMSVFKVGEAIIICQRSLNFVEHYLDRTPCSYKIVVENINFVLEKKWKGHEIHFSNLCGNPVTGRT